jgi:hypothetical protein
MPTYPVSPQLTVDALLKQPTMISRDLVNVLVQRGGFVADQIFAKGTPESVAGGAMRFQRSESAYPDRNDEEIAARGDWPRTGWTEALMTAAVKQFGLETVINGLAIRRNQMDQITRGERKLANQLVKFVDTQAMALLLDTTGNPTIQTQAASAFWTIAGTDVISDVSKAQEKLDILDEGLIGSTLVLNKVHRKSLINNTVLRAALPREVRDASVQTGDVLPFMGLDKILFTNQLAAQTGILMDPVAAGTIADERPDPAEGWQAYDPGPGFAPIYVMVYDEKRPKDKIIASGRWPAMALIEPRAICLITGISA